MKNLMLSTAVLAGLTGAAMAQDATSGMFRPSADPMDVNASDFIGMRVYASEATFDADEYAGAQADWRDIGEINDVVLSRDGTIDAVLVDIGGFLGIGERQVAVGMESIRFVGDASTENDPDDFFLVMTAAQADLEAAPEYMRSDAMMGADGATAPGNDVSPDDAALVTDESVVDDAMTGTETTGADMADTDMVDVRDPITRDGYLTAEAEYLTSERLQGARVYDADDNWIGDVGNLLLTDDGQVTQAVIDVGGFLGIGEKPVALNIADVDILRTEAGDEVRVYLSMTKDQLEELPRFEG